MKKGKVLKIMSIMALAAVLLTGCVDAMPDLTAEQTELIAEYAAGLILKYSPKYNYKIVSDEEVAAARELMQEAPETEETEEPGTGIPEETQQDSSQNPSGQESAETETAESQPAEVISSPDIDLAAELGIDDVIIRYQSFELCDSYPQNNSGFSVSAAQGKKLLVIHFDIEGSPESDVDCSMFEYELGVRMNINDTVSVSGLSTLIPNDLSSFMDVVPAGGIVDTVVVAEVGEMTEQEIQSLTLRMAANGQDCTVKIK